MDPQDFVRHDEKLGARTAEAISSAANKAGDKVDAALDYVNEKTQQVTETLQRARQEGWDGVRRRASDYARNAPLPTLLATMGFGILVGWFLRRESR
jgi:ElaB/YqjD/DUF883 family membrane-anchored ribosome-binding protein